MARTPSLLSADTEATMDAQNLRRVLVRLEQQIMLAGPASPLLHSSFERDKVAQNLEYARTLLLRIQHNDSSAAGKLSQAKRHAQQAELTRHRALVKRLTEKLYDMRRQDDGDDGGHHQVVGIYANGSAGEPEPDEPEDLLAKYFAPEHVSAPTPSSHSRGGSASKGISSTALTSDGVRSRNVKGGPVQPSATSTGTSTAMPTKPSSKAELFATTAKPSAFGLPAELSTEKRLAHQDATQAELTESLVSLAQQLKASSLAFADDLAADNQALNRTEGALGKNQDGLDAASKRMGVLRKMTEGRWWWQRYIMFILLAVAWVLEIAIVFFGPKLRF